MEQAFAARGWECVGVDLVEYPAPENCRLVKANVLDWDFQAWDGFDFIVASSPCEEFSVWGMKHFHPDPKYPSLGIQLFNRTRELCEDYGVPYVMENVKQAQKFVGNAKAHAGSFYLWGNAVPPLLHKGLVKGFGDMSAEAYAKKGVTRWTRPSVVATIPPELANCVADYAERILEQKLAVQP